MSHRFRHCSACVWSTVEIWVTYDVHSLCMRTRVTCRHQNISDKQVFFFVGNSFFSNSEAIRLWSCKDLTLQLRKVIMINTATVSYTMGTHFRLNGTAYWMQNIVFFSSIFKKIQWKQSVQNTVLQLSIRGYHRLTVIIPNDYLSISRHRTMSFLNWNQNRDNQSSFSSLCFFLLVIKIGNNKWNAQTSFHSSAFQQDVKTRFDHVFNAIISRYHHKMYILSLCTNYLISLSYSNCSCNMLLLLWLIASYQVVSLFPIKP